MDCSALKRRAKFEPRLRSSVDVMQIGYADDAGWMQMKTCDCGLKRLRLNSMAI